MLARRLLLLCCLLLVVGGLASLIAPAPDSTPVRPAPPAPLAPGPDAPGGAPVVRGVLPAEKVVRADVGDVVQLIVSGAVADEAQIAALGLRAPLDPQTPAELTLVADRPGRFPVSLLWAGKRVGVLEVDQAP